MKPAVRYIIRAVKYFCWFAILFTLIISALAFTKFVPADNGVAGLFVHGWKSVLEIAGVFLVFSALYPKFGYQKRQVSIPGEWSEVSAEVKGYFADRGEYRGVRIARLWEDRITVTPVFGGVELEGPAKDLARLVSHMEYKLRGE